MFAATQTNKYTVNGYMRRDAGVSVMVHARPMDSPPIPVIFEGNISESFQEGAGGRGTPRAVARADLPTYRPPCRPSVPPLPQPPVLPSTPPSSHGACATVAESSCRTAPLPSTPAKSRLMADGTRLHVRRQIQEREESSAGALHRHPTQYPPLGAPAFDGMGRRSQDGDVGGARRRPLCPVGCTSLFLRPRRGGGREAP